MKWKRRKKHAWMDSIPDDEKPMDSCTTRRRIKRYYTPKGKKLWPLFIISVGPGYRSWNPLLSFHVSGTSKEDPEDHMTEADIPNELFGEVVKMIRHYMKSIEGKRTDYKNLEKEEAEARRTEWQRKYGHLVNADNDDDDEDKDIAF